jgi:hypothetical protein
VSKTKGRQTKPTKSQRHAGSGTKRGGSRTAPGSKSKRPTEPTEQAAPTEQPGPTVRPLGQRLFDMPYSSQVPSPVRADLGLASLVARAGHNAGYDIDLTLLDATDHRLIRTGVVLAHRVLDGRGEWYLGAPDWSPLLPKELIVPMGQGEVPDQLAELVRPFRRGATLSPVAALRCERREFSLRNTDGQTVALLRDDKVTVRRNGLTTARYREVMMTPIGPGLDAAQAEWLGACLGSAGATEMERFPRLVRRLGAPATGPSDLPVPANLTGGTFGQFLTQLLGAGARDLIAADLAFTTGLPRAEERLVESARILGSRLEGLRAVLGADWVSDVVDDLVWLVTPVDPEPSPPRGPGWPEESPRSDDLAALGGPSSFDDATPTSPTFVGGCRARLHSVRYLSLLERLVAAARAPRTGAGAAQPAIEGVESLYRSVLSRFTRAADRLALDGPSQTWDVAWSAAQELSNAAVIRALVDRDATASDLDRLAGGFDLLEQAHRADHDAAMIMDALDGLTAAEAFEAGRRFERDRETARTVRAEFLSRWPKVRRKLG